MIKVSVILLFLSVSFSGAKNTQSLCFVFFSSVKYILYMPCVIQIEKDCFSYSAGVDVMNKTEMRVSVRGVRQMINLF